MLGLFFIQNKLIISVYDRNIYIYIYEILHYDDVGNLWYLIKYTNEGD